jgi:hypothetical protein
MFKPDFCSSAQACRFKYYLLPGNGAGGLEVPFSLAPAFFKSMRRLLYSLVASFFAL